MLRLSKHEGLTRSLPKIAMVSTRLGQDGEEA